MPKGVRNVTAGNGNGHRWGQIAEIRVGEIPPLRISPWIDLYDELLLRLEQTSERFALRVPVASVKDGASCVSALRKNFNRHPGPESVSMTVREKNGEACVFIWLGPAWPSK